MKYCCPSCGRRPISEFEDFGEVGSSSKFDWAKVFIPAEPFSQYALLKIICADRKILMRHKTEECDKLFIV